MDTSRVTISGGSLYALDAANNSQAVVSGGSFSGGLGLNDNSFVTVSGGSFATETFVFRNSRLNVSGGTMAEGIEVDDTSQLNVSGGTIAGLFVFDTSRVTISGGTFEQYKSSNFFDNTTGTFTFVGNGLSAVATGPDGSGGTYYRLTGSLQGGQSVAGNVVDVAKGASMFTLVAAPEPSQFAALGMGVLGLTGLTLRARHRKSDAA